MGAFGPGAGYPPTVDAAHDLDLLSRARTPLITIESHEEERLMRLLRRIAGAQGLEIYEWTITDGLSAIGSDNALYDSKQPLRALGHVETIRRPALFFLKDMAAYLEEPAVVRKIRDLAHSADGRRTLVLSGPHVDLPHELAKTGARMTLALPSHEELVELAWKVVGQFSNGLHVHLAVTKEQLDELVSNLTD